jgi:hypothetical protein
MSGGSLNYIYSKIEMDAQFLENTPERRAFAKHLKLVIKALHDIEWVDSSDYGEGDENEAIRSCLAASDILAETIEQAIKAKKELDDELMMCLK